MIKSFRSKGLAVFWRTGRSARIAPMLQARITVRLDALDRALTPEDMNLPGYNFHALRGKPQRYAVHVNGPWCIAFEWDGSDASRVDLEQYH